MRRTIWFMLPLAGIAAAADLNVKRVILYKHGVAYFERAGELPPGESARLDFKASEMDDVLKSLTVTIEGGSGVAGLRYDSSEPLSRKLAALPVQLGKQQPLSALLDQLKGAQVEMQFSTEKVRGAILSARLSPATPQHSEREDVTLLLSSGEIRTVSLSAASSIRFLDPELQLQLKDYLSAVTQARSMESRSVYIDSDDRGRRKITATYMIPAPVWKSSYRLIFSNAAQPVLEGWAIVDNTTSDDWIGVQLALVSGRPISFRSPLYEPKYMERPVATLPEEQASAPVLLAGALQSEAAPPPSAPAPPPAAKMLGRMAVAGAAPEPVRDDVSSSLAATASGRDLGELFEYRFQQPVTVRKGASAMLPFLQQKLEARKLLIYNDESKQHPMSAAELTNLSGKTLDGGPITVYDAGAYAGEALMETLKAGDKRLISYGLDLGTRVSTRFESAAEVVREIHFRRGVLETRAALQETKTYIARNADQKAKTLIIEHPARAGYKLLNQKPAETTPGSYRFELALGPGATGKFPVIEERLLSRSYSITNLTPDVLGSYAQNKDLSPEARKQLGALLELKRQLAAVEGQLQRTGNQIQELFRDQERIRQNLASLNRVSGQQAQVQSYAAQLSQQEGELAKLRDRQSGLQKQQTDLQAAIAALIEKMEF